MATAVASERRQSLRSRVLEGAFDIAVPVAILSAYYLTLAPSIAGGDSGEVVAEGVLQLFYYSCLNY